MEAAEEPVEQVARCGGVAVCVGLSSAVVVLAGAG
jgi:hypothetical protein